MTALPLLVSSTAYIPPPPPTPAPQVTPTCRRGWERLTDSVRVRALRTSRDEYRPHSTLSNMKCLPRAAVNYWLSPPTLTDNSPHHSLQSLTHILTRKDVGYQGVGGWGQHAPETVPFLRFFHTNISRSADSTN